LAEGARTLQAPYSRVGSMIEPQLEARGESASGNNNSTLALLGSVTSDVGQRCEDGSW
jgi:hypothetical protein